MNKKIESQIETGCFHIDNILVIICIITCNLYFIQAERENAINFEMFRNGWIKESFNIRKQVSQCPHVPCFNPP